MRRDPIVPRYASLPRMKPTLLLTLLALGGCATPLPAESIDDPHDDAGTPPLVDAANSSSAHDAAPTTNGTDASTSTTVDAHVDPGTSDAGSVVVAPHAGVVVGYYPGWATYDRDFQVAEIPASGLTHVNYAFANIANGRCVVGDAWADTQKTFPGDTWEEQAASTAGNFKQLRLLKQRNPSLRTLISVGGWTWSGAFSDVALTDASRRDFASSCVDLMVAQGFDGLDIDWEYPEGGGLPGNVARPADRANYTLLLQAIRAELVARAASSGRSEAYLLSIAAPAGPSIIPHLDAAAIAGIVDWINVMTYDFHGAWDTTTGHDAPLVHTPQDPSAAFDVTSAVDAYLAAGVPASRLVMGVPFYGRSFAGVSAGTTHGLYRPATGAGPGTWEAGVLDYSDIVARYLGAPGFVAYRDDAASVPYLFNATSGVFITYDDASSIAAKRELARARNLAGTMIWDLSSDTPGHALLSALNGP